MPFSNSRFRRRCEYNEGMARRVQAIYESGVLRPVEPLVLSERQLVEVIILDEALADEGYAFAPPSEFEPAADHGVSIEAVRQALYPITGSLDREFSEQRDER